MCLKLTLPLSPTLFSFSISLCPFFWWKDEAMRYSGKQHFETDEKILGFVYKICGLFIRGEFINVCYMHYDG
jgi:hypothetical protein